MKNIYLNKHFPTSNKLHFNWNTLKLSHIYTENARQIIKKLNKKIYNTPSQKSLNRKIKLESPFHRNCKKKKIPKQMSYTKSKENTKTNIYMYIYKCERQPRLESRRAAHKKDHFTIKKIRTQHNPI